MLISRYRPKYLILIVNSAGKKYNNTHFVTEHLNILLSQKYKEFIVQSSS